MRINKILAKRVPLVTAFVAFALLVTGCSNKVDNNDNSSNENDYFEDYIEPKATLVNSLEYSGDINNYKIDGKYHSVNPIVYDNYKVFRENTRECTLVKTNNFKNIMYVEVGALLVGKICNIKKQGKFKKGEEKGYFINRSKIVNLNVIQMLKHCYDNAEMLTEKQIDNISDIAFNL